MEVFSGDRIPGTEGARVQDGRQRRRWSSWTLKTGSWRVPYWGFVEMRIRFEGSVRFLGVRRIGIGISWSPGFAVETKTGSLAKNTNEKGHYSGKGNQQSRSPLLRHERHTTHSLGEPAKGYISTLP